MSETITLELYEIHELDDDAWDAALDDHRYINVQDVLWYEPIIEQAEADLLQQGMTEVEIHFSRLFSQGGGACITGRLDVPEWSDQEYPGYARIRKRRDSIGTRYDHPNTVVVSYDPEPSVKPAIMRWQCRRAKQIAQHLRARYMAETEDEAVASALADQEARFQSDGTRFD